MHIRSVEYDGDGNAESDLARLWCNGGQGERQRITDAAFKAELILLEFPEAGIAITNGVNPPVRYLDRDILRVFYQVFEAHDKIIIIGFTLSP
jgi:hypothetical protein